MSEQKYQSKEEIIIMPEDIEEIRKKRRKEMGKKKTKGRTRNVIFLFLSLIFFIFTSYFLITPAGIFRLYLTSPSDLGLLIGRLLGQISLLIIPIIVISYLIWHFGFKKERKFFSIFSLIFFLAASFGLIVTLFKILS